MSAQMKTVSIHGILVPQRAKLDALFHFCKFFVTCASAIYGGFVLGYRPESVPRRMCNDLKQSNAFGTIAFGHQVQRKRGAAVLVGWTLTPRPSPRRRTWAGTQQAYGSIGIPAILPVGC